MSLDQITVLSIVIPGVAAPQGSKRHVGRGRLVEASKRLKPWRDSVVEAIRTHRGDNPLPPIEAPVELDVTFYLPRPAAAKNRWAPHKGGPGDLDKLVRAIGDALTEAQVWKDDAQVVDLHAKKRYAIGEPGISITVRNLEAVAHMWDE